MACLHGHMDNDVASYVACTIVEVESCVAHRTRSKKLFPINKWTAMIDLRLLDDGYA
jgi:hypothetical protein